MFRFVHWRSLARRKQFEAEMHEEFQFHREARIEHFVRQGCTREEAARRARLRWSRFRRRSAHRRSRSGRRWQIRKPYRSARPGHLLAHPIAVQLNHDIGDSISAATFRNRA
jgi:hypothetical protein